MAASRPCSAQTLRRPSARGLFSLLLPVALILHEAAYLIARSGQCCSGEELSPPMIIAVAAVVGGAWSSVLVPLVAKVRDDQRSLAVPAAITVALVTIFVSQEAMEVLLLGDEPAVAQAALAFLAPIAAALGLLGGALARLACRAAVALVAIVSTNAGRTREVRAIGRHAPSATATPAMAAPLAFGLARRPPPAFL
jgi:hypothetical protein